MISIYVYIIYHSKLAKFILVSSLDFIPLYIIYHSKLAMFILVSSLDLIPLYIIYYSKLAKFILGTSLDWIMLKEYLLFKTSEVHPCNFARFDSPLYICSQYFISLIIQYRLISYIAILPEARIIPDYLINDYYWGLEMTFYD